MCDRSLLQALARLEVFVVSIPIARSDAASVPERWRGQILHGVLGPREYVVTEELPLGQIFIELTQQELRCVRREGGQSAQGLRREWSGKSPLSEALTEARLCQSKMASRSWSSRSR